MPNQLQQRIERLLIEHTFIQGDDEQQGGCVGASCCWHGWFLGDWRRHVAEVLVSELGLTPEYGVVYESDYPELPEEITDERDEAYASAAEKCLSCNRCRNALPKHVEVRYVSEWIADA